MKGLIAAALMATGLVTSKFTAARAGLIQPVELLRSWDRPKDLIGKMVSVGLPFQKFADRIVPLGEGRRWKPHNGASEIARRRRQIERGTLTASNGLCISKGRRIINVPFDMLNRGDRFWFSRAAA